VTAQPRAVTGQLADRPAGAGPDTSSLLLHAWRRLDWRFLLPTDAYARVACGGAVDQDLREALPLLAGEVHEPTAPWDWDALAGTCDVVVLVEPTPAQLRAAVHALRPGGWLYAEVRRTVRTAGPRSLVGWRRATVRAGLVEVVAHWHAASLTEPQRIVSLDAPMALRHALRRSSGGIGSLLRAGLVRTLVAAGLFPMAVPAGSVIGRRPGPTS
jgi:hypothetical protein